MKCPTCGKEMETGHLAAAGHRILWTDRNSRLTASLKPNEELVEESGFWGELYNAAHICKRCHKIIVDY